MLFTINKNKSLALLKVAMALFIVLAPIFLQALGKETGAYFVCFISAALLLMRIRSTEKIYVSIFHFIMLTLLFYSIIASLWAGNRGGHLIYLLVIGAAVMFYCVCADYFYENDNDKLKRRMMYMFCGGGFLCAILNILYWVMYIVPVAGKTSFSQGLGSSDFLAVFMLFGICSSILLIKGNSTLRRNILILSAVIMLFVFAMTQSLIGWTLAILIVTILIISKKTAKLFVPAAICVAALFTLIVILVMRFSQNGALFVDIFNYSLKYPFGIGGGFESAGELFKTRIYPQNCGVGLLAELFACSGILGLLCAVAICGWSATHFARLKSWESLIELFVTVLIMLIPFDKNFVVLLFYIALTAYNEQAASRLTGRIFKKKALVKVGYLLGTVLVISALLLCQSIIKGRAYVKFKNGDYSGAFNMYAAASSMNITDSQSCHMAARSLRMGGTVCANYEEAHNLIDKAIQRDKKNIAHIEEKAKIYYECGEYDQAAQEYKRAAQRAIVKEKYNLSIVETLYEYVKRNPKGSSETKRAYEEMVQIANGTGNLDYKKMINDIADKALSYTKGELNIEEVAN